MVHGWARGCMSDHVAAHSASVLPDFVQKWLRAVTFKLVLFLAALSKPSG